MWKKICFSVGMVLILIAGIEIFDYVKKDTKQQSNEENIVQNQTEISSKYVTDECINEWEDYSEVVKNEIKQTGGNLSDENRCYILKDEDDVIKVYYLNENGEEVLYKVTDISTNYLSGEDVNKLKSGIEIKGLTEMNEMLEDFE